MEYEHEFEIPRPKWLVLEGDKDSYLYRDLDGKQCCVGHYLASLGFTKSDLGGTCTAHYIQRNYSHLIQDKIKEKISWLIKIGQNSLTSSSVGEKLYVANDGTDNSNHIREFETFKKVSLEEKLKMLANKEKEITDIFAKQKIKVTFTGEYNLKDPLFKQD